MTNPYRAICAELLAAIQLYTGLNPAASEMSSVEITEKLMDAMAATVAALATPPQEPPNWREPMKQPDFRALCAALVDEATYESPTTCLARATRRPKPPSLKEQALAALRQVGNCEEIDNATFDTIRRALEAL